MTFATVPSRLIVEGGEPSGVEFRRIDPAALRAAAERAESERRRELEERTRREEADRERRFADAVKAVAELSRAMREQIERELAALEPEFSRLALRIAERAVRTGLQNDPLLLLPAIERAMKSLRAGLDEPALVSLHVAQSDAERFAAALANHDPPVRVVSEAGFESGRFEARLDIRRVRFSVARELENVGAMLETPGGGDG